MTDEQRKQELLQQTLFYKGEEDYAQAPYVFDGQSAGYWDYESLWVKWELEQDEDYLRTVHWFQTEILKDQPLYPSVPLGLQAIFANRISYWSGGRNPVSMEAVSQFCKKYQQTFHEAQNR